MYHDSDRLRARNLTRKGSTITFPTKVGSISNLQLPYFINSIVIITSITTVFDFPGHISSFICHLLSTIFIYSQSDTMGYAIMYPNTAPQREAHENALEAIEARIIELGETKFEFSAL